MAEIVSGKDRQLKEEVKDLFRRIGLIFEDWDKEEITDDFAKQLLRNRITSLDMKVEKLMEVF